MNRPTLCLLTSTCLGLALSCGGTAASSESSVGTSSSSTSTTTTSGGDSTTIATAEIVVYTTNGYRVSGYSVWEGRYVCAQGVTGLTLELTGSGGPSVTAVFRFYAVPENPTVPSGSYSLTGVARGDGAIDLIPERWFEQPSGYVMVGMTGMLDTTTGTMRGMITNPGCAAFDLHRTL